MSIVDLIYKASRNAFAWVTSRQEDGSLVLTPDYKDGLPARSFTLNEFAQADCRLPELITFWHESGLCRLSDGELPCAWKYWKVETVILPGSALCDRPEYADSSIALHMAGNFKSVANGLAGELASWYELDTLPSGLQYAKRSRFGGFVIARSWLDNHYAHWEQRLAVGTTLGLTPVEMKSHLFNEHALPITRNASALAQTSLPGDITP